MKKIVIKQKSLISPLGNLQDTVSALYSGKTSIEKSDLFDMNLPFSAYQDTKLRNLDYATQQISSELELSSLEMARTVFVYATAKGSLEKIEGKIIDNSESKEYPSPLLDEQQSSIEEILGIKPACSIVVSNACASGAAAIEVAKEYIESGEFDHAVLFGFDAISKFTATGFFSLGALSNSGAKPFDKNRDGLTMGEITAAALISMEEPKIGDIYIAGAGSANDANHRTGPSRTGDGLLAAMNASLRDAQLTAEDIGAVKCHGTSTNYNDAMEAKALFSLFGEEIPPSVSLKGAIGHTSGAGSLAEILIASEFFKQRKIPPTFSFENLGVEEPVNISNNSQQFDKNSILCLAAGFGGLNSAVIISEKCNEE